jgi:hypothetical protein
MSKFTKQQRQELKSLVANAMIRCLDVFETQEYIQDSLHVTISPDYVYHVNMQLKRDCTK